MFARLPQSMLLSSLNQSAPRPTATQPLVSVLGENIAADNAPSADESPTFDPLVDSSASILFLFPADIILSVFYEWLTSRDISALDIAMCSKQQRSAYLQLLSSPFPASKWVFRRSFDNFEMLTWLSSRRVAMYQLKLFSIGSPNDFDHFPLFCKSLRVLDLCSLNQLTDQHVTQLLEVCAHSLTHVTINHCQRVTMDTVTRLMSSCGSLVHLELVELAFDHGCLPPDLPRPLALQSLVLKRATTFTLQQNSAPFHCLFRALPELQTANISLRCDSEPWIRELSQTCPKLRQLTVGSIAINVDNFFQLLATSFPHLPELCVQNLARACAQTTASVEAIGSFHQMQSLLFGSERVQDYILEALSLSSGHFLRELRLFRAQHITDRSMHALAMACAQLEVLECQAAAITDRGLHEVLVHCTRLRSVAFPYCDQVHAVSFASLAEHGAALEEIDMYQVHYENAAAVLSVLAGCPRLRKFTFSDWVEGTREKVQRTLAERFRPTPPVNSVAGEGRV